MICTIDREYGHWDNCARIAAVQDAGPATEMEEALIPEAPVNRFHNQIHAEPQVPVQMAMSVDGAPTPLDFSGPYSKQCRQTLGLTLDHQDSEHRLRLGGMVASGKLSAPILRCCA